MCLSVPTSVSRGPEQLYFSQHTASPVISVSREADWSEVTSFAAGSSEDYHIFCWNWVPHSYKRKLLSYRIWRYLVRRFGVTHCLHLRGSWCGKQTTNKQLLQDYTSLHPRRQYSSYSITMLGHLSFACSGLSHRAAWKDFKSDLSSFLSEFWVSLFVFGTCPSINCWNKLYFYLWNFISLVLLHLQSKNFVLLRSGLLCDLFHLLFTLPTFLFQHIL